MPIQDAKAYRITLNYIDGDSFFSEVSAGSFTSYNAASKALCQLVSLSNLLTKTGSQGVSTTRVLESVEIKIIGENNA